MLPLDRMRRWALATAMVVLGAALAAAANPPCPGTAAVNVYARNLSDDANVDVTVEGDLVDVGATCTGSGAITYTTTLRCTGHGLVRCGEVTGLRPGTWINRLGATVTGSAAQEQAQRTVFVTGGANPGTNALQWTLFPRTFVVTQTTAADLQAQLDAAAAFTAGDPSRPALVRFDRTVFPGADTPQTIPFLGATTCDPTPGGCQTSGGVAGLCVRGSHVVLDALDANARTGGVVLDAGSLDLRGVRVYCSGNVLRGLVVRGGRFPVDGSSTQADTLDFSPGARANRLELSTIHGPSLGDTVSGESGPGPSADATDDNVIDRSDLRDAEDKGLKVTSGARVQLVDSCVRDNRNGGVQATLGGIITARRNVVERNLPGGAQNGLWARGDPDDPLAPRSLLVTDGNLVRFNGTRGLSVTDAASAVFANDFVSDNGVVGLRVESTVAGTRPEARVGGVALVCNHRDRLTGTCQTPAKQPCVSDTDCSDVCSPTFPDGAGVVLTACTADGCLAPAVVFGDAVTAGGNVFAFNPNDFTNPVGINLDQRLAGVTVAARGNQWEHCGTTGSCDVAAVLASDVVRAPGADLEVAPAVAARAGAPTLTTVVPARPVRDQVVRLYGAGFNAIDGVACAPENELAPPVACTGRNDEVAAANRPTQPYGNHVSLSIGGHVYPSLDVWAVTPTMLAVRMPVDCFAPGTITIERTDAGGTSRSATIDVCRAASCSGEPVTTPCDDGDPCTTGDHCSGTDDTCVPGTPETCDGPCEAGPCDPERGCGARTCSGPCLTGACDPTTGCVPRLASTTCSDGDACTQGDACNGAGACVGGSPIACTDHDLCRIGTCDRIVGCAFADAQGYDAISCRTASITRALEETGSGDSRLARLVIRVDTAIGRARAASDAGRRAEARRRLAGADTRIVAVLGAIRGAGLRGQVATEVRALARAARAAIAGQRRAERVSSASLPGSS